MLQSIWLPIRDRQGVSNIARLAQVRHEKGMTQEQLAAATGVNRVTIARIETGEVSPKAETLMRLADALGVLIDDLIDRGAG